jgi:hypothetical protein
MTGRASVRMIALILGVVSINAFSDPILINPQQQLEATFPPDGTVAIDQGLIFVGSPSSPEGGVVSVYERENADDCDPERCWVLKEQLRRPDSFPGDAFGTSIDFDGRTLVIGSTAFEREGSDAVFIYRRTNERQRGEHRGRERDRFVFEQRLKGDPAPPDPGGQTNFGVAVVVEGNRLVITELPIFNIGSAYLYKRGEHGRWRREAKLHPDVMRAQYGVSADLDHDALIIGADVPGFADVFRRHRKHWRQEARLIPWDKPEADGFGRSVALSGNQAAVGDYIGGAVYVFRKHHGDWVPVQKLERSDANDFAFFGMSTLLRHERIAAFGRDGIYLFQRRGHLWVEVAKLVGPDIFAPLASTDLMDWDGNTLVAVGFTGIWIFDTREAWGAQRN